MKRRDFLKTAGMSVAAITLGGCRFPTYEQRKTRPNIIVITCDDMGYADIGVHGCRDVPTPNIDSIARKGIRFTNGYVTAPECSPSRAGLMTGRYQQRFGHEFNPGPPPRGVQDHVGLPLNEFTIADVLAAAGYVTGAVGKWHLGTAPRFHPLKRSFHEFFGFLHGGRSYVDSGLDSFNPVMRGTTAVSEQQYLTDAFTREALSFIKRHRQKPFFLYLAYNAPHKPLHCSWQYVYGFQKIKDPRRRMYVRMIASLDYGIGKLLLKLKRYGIEKDTLVFFLNDNGGVSKKFGASNAPLRGGKSYLFEGAIRVPFIIQWPLRFSADTTFDDPVSSLDILPTIAAAAGAKLARNRVIDGVNLIPYLTGKNKDQPHEILFWRIGRSWAARKQNWKLIKDGDQNLLFDLTSDIGESRDLVAKHPDVVKELTKAYEKWNSQMVEPLWPSYLREQEQLQEESPSGLTDAKLL